MEQHRLCFTTRFIVVVLLTSSNIFSSVCADSGNDGSLVVALKNSSSSSTSNNVQNISSASQATSGAEIYSMHINANIRYRYSLTQVVSRVVNRDSRRSNEVKFQIVLPSSAFISKFVMDIDGKLYEAYVKEKDEAKKIYNEAKRRGQAAGIVEVSARDSNVFNMNINLKPLGKITFNLTYEEFLVRKLSRYEQSINISPEQISQIRDFKITVNILESQNLTLLRVPKLKKDIETSTQDNDEVNPNARIDRPTPKSAFIEWSPSANDQAQLNREGVNGKFLVLYDVARPASGGEILLMNGYFVHFFAPNDLLALRKHVVFVLDVSGSMAGRKLVQLKSAMSYILDDLKPDDYFNIITFSSTVKGWNPKISAKTPSSTPATYNYQSNYRHQLYAWRSTSTVPVNENYRFPVLADEINLRNCHNFINQLIASGATDINAALQEALNLVLGIKRYTDKETIPEQSITTSTLRTTTRADDYDLEELPVLPDSPARIQATSIKTFASSSSLPSNVESIIIFLTDGEPTEGVTDPTSIQSRTKLANANSSIPIFSLGFGDGADFPFLRKLSLQNNGFARKIYEASDADLQLKGFFREISSPLLSNITFKYTSDGDNANIIKQLTKVKFPKMFDGSELVIAGRFIPKKNKQHSTSTTTPNSDSAIDSNDLKPISVEINANGRNGFVSFGEEQIIEYDVGGNSGNGRFNYIMVNNSLTFPRTTTVEPETNTTRIIDSGDTFMERLWAYLSIKQLLEKDVIANEAGNGLESREFSDEEEDNNLPPLSITPVEKETPRERALRLSLKYGFVTPLTSLVVVKPNETESSNDGVAINPTLEAASSSDQNQNIRNAPTRAQQARYYLPSLIMSTTAWPTRQSKMYLRNHDDDDDEEDYESYSQARVNSGNSRRIQKQMQTVPGGQANHGGTQHRAGGYRASISSDRSGISLSHQQQNYPSTSTSASTTIRPRYVTTSIPNTVKSQLKLENISWITSVFNNYSTLVVNQTTYHIASDSDKVPIASRPDRECRNNGTTIGICTHLKHCVLPNFVDDIEVYYNSFFCPLKARHRRHKNLNYAGVCCPSI